MRARVQFINDARVVILEEEPLTGWRKWGFWGACAVASFLIWAGIFIALNLAEIGIP